jgi:hypothetical protein
LMKNRNRDKNRVRCIGKNRWHGGGKLSSSGFDVRVLPIWMKQGRVKIRK